MQHPHALAALTTREAIADVVYRAVLGYDRNDASLLQSALQENAVFEICENGQPVATLDGLSKVRELSLRHIGPMDTTHMIGNIRIDLGEAGPNATTASLTCYAYAQHCPEGRGREADGRKFMSGGEYQLEVEKDSASGQWKARKWVLDLIWTQGDRSIMPTHK